MGPNLPRPREDPNRPKRVDGGCTLVVKNLEPAFLGLPNESSYLSVLETADEIEEKIKEMKRWQKVIKLTRNDYTIWCGDEVRINPNYIVSIT